MARLEEIDKGSIIRGVLPDQAVTVVDVEWVGDDSVDLTFRNSDGDTDSQLLFRHDEEKLHVVEGEDLWDFSGDGRTLRLVSEAKRIQLAHLFDPYVAMNSSDIEPYPHQLEAVYGEMLPQKPLRFCLADDPGAGKTIMAGLYMKELMIREGIERILVVPPGSLVENWQNELADRFEIHLPHFTNQMAEDSFTGNPFEDYDKLLARMHHLAWNEDYKQMLEDAPDWDLVVVDEAHKMGAHYWGGEVETTLLYELGELLSEKSRHFLTMTATPHNGKEDEFQLFLKLLDPDRFEGAHRLDGPRPDPSDVMRRMIKEELTDMEGEALFPPREAHTVQYDLSPEELSLYEDITTYVREEMNRAQRIRDGGKRFAIGLALTVLQRRVASSPEAIYQSIKNRRKRLKDRIGDVERKRDREPVEDLVDFQLELTEDELEDLEEGGEDFTAEEREEKEDEILDEATAATTIEELEKEIETLEHLEDQARELRAKKIDRKWDELRELLEHEEMRDEEGNLKKLIIFTEHTPTLEYLAKRIRSLTGKQESVLTIHGGMGRQARLDAQEKFWYDPDTSVLVATDAAGEGINLHCAHLMINYDLPWNPNRLEQRFGRIHRIGQENVCHMWNLVAGQTREGDVYLKLLDKIDQEEKALGSGKVFDVLGQAFEETSLRDLMVEAIQRGDDVQVKQELKEKIDRQLDRDRIEELRAEDALADEIRALSDEERQQLQQDLERAKARKLQPHFISSFFREAFTRLDGTIHEREKNRYEITYVPSKIRRQKRSGRQAPIQERYQRVTFHKDQTRIEGKPPAKLIGPGHPLLEAVTELTLENWGPVMERGAILVDPSNGSDKPRLLFYLENAIEDGLARQSEDETEGIASKEYHFVEMLEGDEMRTAGYAPYLDFEPLEAVVEDEAIREQLRDELEVNWVPDNWEERAQHFAVQELVPDHLERVKRKRIPRIEKIEDSVTKRLRDEIMHWDQQLQERREEAQREGKDIERATKRPRERLEKLKARRDERLDELKAQKQLSASRPKIVGGALVAPQAHLEDVLEDELDVATEATDTDEPPRQVEDTETSELAAMEAVMAKERELGNEPTDVSDRRGIGYDIESKTPEGEFRFIEVKARHPKADNVTVTKNEVVAALNAPGSFRLAIVIVDDGEAQEPVYVEEPWDMEPDFHVTSVRFKLDELMARGGTPA